MSKRVLANLDRLEIDHEIPVGRTERVGPRLRERTCCERKGRTNKRQKRTSREHVRNYIAGLFRDREGSILQGLYAPVTTCRLA